MELSKKKCIERVAVVGNAVVLFISHSTEQMQFVSNRWIPSERFSQIEYRSIVTNCRISFPGTSDTILPNSLYLSPASFLSLSLSLSFSSPPPPPLYLSIYISNPISLPLSLPFSVFLFLPSKPCLFYERLLHLKLPPISPCVFVFSNETISLVEDGAKCNKRNVCLFPRAIFSRVQNMCAAVRLPLGRISCDSISSGSDCKVCNEIYVRLSKAKRVHHTPLVPATGTRQNRNS